MRRKSIYLIYFLFRLNETLLYCLNTRFVVQDYEFLYKSGASAIFGPGTKLPIAALNVINLIAGHVDGAKQAAE